MILIVLKKNKISDITVVLKFEINLKNSFSNKLPEIHQETFNLK
jgi:hypothetical protein